MRSSIGNTASDPVFTQAVGAGGAAAPAGTATDPTSTQSAPLPAGTDRSGTVDTASKTLAAANTGRRSLNVQNISANTLGINEFGGTAAIGSPGTYTLAAGATLNVRTRNAVTVIASAAGSAYTATEA